MGTVSFFAAKNIGEKEKIGQQFERKPKLNFLLQTKNSKKIISSEKKNYPLNKKYTHFLRCMDKPFFFLCARMEKKSAIKKLNFCLNSDFFRSCFLKSKMKKKNCKPQNHH